MRLSQPTRPRKEENLVPLINIVFLILIFFLIASTFKPFSDQNIQLAKIEVPSSSSASPRMIVVRSDGARFVGSRSLTDEELRDQLENWSLDSVLPITIVADRMLKATELISLVAQARGAGIKNVKLLTRRMR